MKYRLKNPQMDELLRKNFTAEDIDETIEQYKATELGIVHFNMGKDDGYYLFSFSVRDIEEVTNPLGCVCSEMVGRKDSKGVW